MSDVQKRCRHFAPSFYFLGIADPTSTCCRPVLLAHAVHSRPHLLTAIACAHAYAHAPWCFYYSRYIVSSSPIPVFPLLLASVEIQPCFLPFKKNLYLRLMSGYTANGTTMTCSLVSKYKLTMGCETNFHVTLIFAKSNSTSPLQS